MPAVLEARVEPMPRSSRDRAVHPAFERERVIALRRGDAAARDDFFDHFYDRVFQFVAATVRDDHLAEDLTHEIFLKLHAALHRLDPEREPSRFVFTVASNAIRDHWRRHETRATRNALDLDDVHDPPADGAARIDESLVVDENHRRVHEAMADLSDEDREILALRAFGELDNEDAARALGIRVEAVRQRWSRAVRRLGVAYRALEAEGGDA